MHLPWLHAVAVGTEDGATNGTGVAQHRRHTIRHVVVNREQRPVITIGVKIGVNNGFCGHQIGLCSQQGPIISDFPRSRRWDSNPRPAVYETAALPLSYAGEASCTKLLRGGRARVQRGSVYCGGGAIVKQLRWAEATSSSSREAVPRGSSERRWRGSWGRK